MQQRPHILDAVRKGQKSCHNCTELIPKIKPKPSAYLEWVDNQIKKLRYT